MVLSHRDIRVTQVLGSNNFYWKVITRFQVISGTINYLYPTGTEAKQLTLYSWLMWTMRLRLINKVNRYLLQICYHIHSTAPNPWRVMQRPNICLIMSIIRGYVRWFKPNCLIHVSCTYQQFLAKTFCLMIEIIFVGNSHFHLFLTWLNFVAYC